MKQFLFTTLLSSALLTSSAQVTNGLVAEYPFTYAGRFDYKYSNHTTIMGATPTADRFGHDNMAYYFDGVDDYLIAPQTYDIDLNQMTNGISISAWVNPAALPSSGLVSLVTKWNGFTSEQYGIFMNASGNNVVGIRQVNSNGIADNAAMTIGNWYHVVFTYDATTKEHKVFVNNTNTLTTTPGGTYNPSADTTSLSFGAQANDFNGSVPSPNRFFNGTLDDIRIYNRVLTTQEIDTLYNLDPYVCNGFNVDVISVNDASSSSANDGSFEFNAEGGFAPYTFTINGGSSANMVSGSVCGSCNEGGNINLSSPANTVFTSVSFSSYGTPAGTCSDFSYGTCHSMLSYSGISSSIVGTNSVNMMMNNGPFGDPCFGTGKSYKGQYSYAQSVQINNIPAGTYTVEITDSLGCTATTDITIGSPTGINENSVIANCTFYPNPTEGIIYASAKTYTTIEVLDVTGKIILAKELNGNAVINLSNFESGIYFIKDILTHQTVKIIKE